MRLPRRSQDRAHTVWVPRALRLVFAVLRHLPRGYTGGCHCERRVLTADLAIAVAVP